jgi:hypothetical protein
MRVFAEFAVSALSVWRGTLIGTRVLEPFLDRCSSRGLAEEIDVWLKSQ